MGEEYTYFDQLKTYAIAQKIRDHLLPKGWRIDPKTKKWTAEVGIDFDRPWVYTHIDPARYCGLHQMVFNLYHIIPTYCLEHCWKVVCTPTKVTELFKLLQLQEEIFVPNKIPCKCGMDLREHTSHRYGGYWYCNNQEEWRNRYYQVRKAVDEYIGGHISVIMKRYCTEFEMYCGPSDQYEQPSGAGFIEHTFRELIDYKKMKYARQSDPIKENVKLRWLKYAYQIGDLSCLEFNNGEPFYPKLVTYHKELEQKYRANKEKKNDV